MDHDVGVESEATAGGQRLQQVPQLGEAERLMVQLVPKALRKQDLQAPARAGTGVKPEAFLGEQSKKVATCEHLPRSASLIVPIPKISTFPICALENAAVPASIAQGEIVYFKLKPAVAALTLHSAPRDALAVLPPAAAPCPASPGPLWARSCSPWAPLLWGRRSTRAARGRRSAAPQPQVPEQVPLRGAPWGGSSQQGATRSPCSCHGTARGM